MHRAGALRIWVRCGLIAAIGATLFLAACGEPDPPPPPPPDPVLAVAPAPPPPPPPPPPLQPAPGGAAAAPLDPKDAPDPSVTPVDPSWCEPGATQCYYAYTTQAYLTIAPVWRSSDLVHWSLDTDYDGAGSAMPVLAPWVEWGHNWAPSVVERPNNPESSRWVMWYTARDKASGKQCLGVATAPRPAGPFVDTSTKPAYCQLSEGGTIDPSVFTNFDGTLWLYYKSESPARLWVARLLPDGITINPGSESWLLSGESPDAPVIEAPTMVLVNGQAYLFYSTDDWWTANYRVGVARCDTFLGPCHRMYSTAVLSSRGSMVGPGGETPFQSQDGGWHMIFHAWTSPTVGYDAGGTRSMRMLPITFGTDVKIG